MKQIKTLAPVALILLLASARLHAQVSGCDDSPENPTAVLGLIAAGAVFGYDRLRTYRRSRRHVGKNQPANI